jgi:hypothetical protein
VLRIILDLKERSIKDRIMVSFIKGKKGKFHPITCHEDTEGEVEV